MTIRNNFVGVKNPIKKVSALKLTHLVAVFGGLAAFVFMSLRSYSKNSSTVPRQFFDPQPNLTEKDIAERLKIIEAAEESLKKKNANNKQKQ